MPDNNRFERLRSTKPEVDYLQTIGLPVVPISENGEVLDADASRPAVVKPLTAPPKAPRESLVARLRLIALVAGMVLVGVTVLVAIAGMVGTVILGVLLLVVAGALGKLKSTWPHLFSLLISIAILHLASPPTEGSSMLQAGTKLIGRTGRSYTVQAPLAGGGQGLTFDAVDHHSEPFVLKAYHPQFADADTQTRLNLLFRLQLSYANPVLCGPVDLFAAEGTVGHIAPKAGGKTLEELLTQGQLSFLASLHVGVAIAQAFDRLHALGLSHGDPHPRNVLVEQTDHATVALIDFDNFHYVTEPRHPKPRWLGHPLYMAPELRENRALPGIETDCFALAAMLHELILRRHVADAHLHDKAAFEKMMCAGVWFDDPNRTAYAPPPAGGLPATLLNQNLCALFRRALTRGPSRASAGEWRHALLQALVAATLCQRCHSPHLTDHTRPQCPNCSQPYPLLALEGTFGRIVLDQPKAKVGRRSFARSKKVSATHAVIYRAGPEYRIADRSRNGTYRLMSDGWVRVPKEGGGAIERLPRLSPGDTLRFANIEARVVNVER